MPDFRRANTEGEGAERTVRARMAIAAHHGLARLSDAQLRPYDVHDAAGRVLQAEQLHAELGAILLELAYLFRRGFNRDRRTPEHLFGARRRRVIHGRER